MDRVTDEPTLFAVLVDEMTVDDPVVRMRAADAAEKVSRTQPDLLCGHERTLQELLADSDQQEAQWHVAQMVPRLELNHEEVETAVERLCAHLDAESKTVVVEALDALDELPRANTQYREEVAALVPARPDDDSAAVPKRAEKLDDRP